MVAETVIMPSLNILAERILALKEQWKQHFIEGLLEFKWSVGKELFVQRVECNSLTFRELEKKTEISSTELFYCFHFYSKYPHHDYPVMAWRETVKALPYNDGDERVFMPNPFNLWNFQDCDPRFGMEIEGFKGRIPGQIVQNLLYYFAPEKGVVVDPMAGTGTTMDVVNWWNKTYGFSLKCLSYDKFPTRSNEIVKNDLIENGLPNETKSCDLIFLDPPYYDMVFKIYKNLSQFYDFIDKLAKDCYNKLNPNGIVGLIMADLTRDKDFEPLTHRCFNIFEKNQFETVSIIVVPLTTQSASGSEVVKARSLKKMLGIRRELIVFRRNENGKDSTA